MLGRVSGTSFEDRTAVPGQRYLYSISSTTAYGDSAFSQPSSSVAGRPQSYDADGDGRADVMTYRQSSGGWQIAYSSGLPPTSVAWGGLDGDVAAPADFNGDGLLDLTIFRPSNGTWYIRGGETTVWGQRGDMPVPADYERQRPRRCRGVSPHHRHLVHPRPRANRLGRAQRHPGTGRL